MKTNAKIGKRKKNGKNKSESVEHATIGQVIEKNGFECMSSYRY